MANISVTYSFTNGTSADAGQVNQNFTDIINGSSDGSKDFSINALTIAGALTANGNTTIGNATGDDLTITASLASTINIKTTAAYNIGSSALGLAGIYFGANLQTVRVIGSGTMSATYTITLPVSAGTSGQVLQNTGSGVLQWSQANLVSAQSADYVITDIDRIRTVVMTTGATNRTVTLPIAANNTDRIINIVKADTGAGTCIIDGADAETINGATTVTMYTVYDQIMVQSNGTTWFILEQNFSAQGMSNIEATRRGLKAYAHGTSYSGSVAPTITFSGGGTLSSVTRSAFIPYQIQDGTWRLRGSLTIAVSSTSRTSAVITVNGISGISGVSQAVSGFHDAASSAGFRCYLSSSSNDIYFDSTAISATSYSLSFDVAVSSKPTWAY